VLMYILVAGRCEEGVVGEEEGEHVVGEVPYGSLGGLVLYGSLGYPEREPEH